VTALFADIKGSMDLMEELDPEEARAMVDPALRLMIDSVHHYNGYLDRWKHILPTSWLPPGIRYRGRSSCLGSTKEKVRSAATVVVASQADASARLLVLAKSAADYATLRSDVAAAGGNVVGELPELNLLVVIAPDRSTVRMIAGSPYSAGIARDRIRQLTPGKALCLVKTLYLQIGV
jgi:hypothetical protein